MNVGECFLELAKIKEDSANLYKEFSKICSEKLKNIGIKFSKEEEKNREIIVKLSANISVKEIQLNDNINDIFKEQRDYIKVKDKNIIPDREKDFFIFALQMEKNSIEMYKKLLSMFEIGSDGYKIFQILLQEEKNHMIYILNELYKLN